MTRIFADTDDAFQDDPLDSRVGTLSAGSDRAWRLPRRLALGLSPTPRIGLILLPLGMAFGPRGLDLMSERVLTALDPAVSAALAALGVLIGIRLDVRNRAAWKLTGAASLGAVVTVLATAGGLLLIQALLTDSARWPWALALLLGACAAPSSSAVGDDSRGLPLSRLADSDDLVPIVLGLAALAWAGLGSGGMVLAIATQTTLIALLIAAAGVLLVSQTPSEGEQHVFVIGTILLVAGAAAHLLVSELFTGVVAGMVFGAQRGAVGDRFERDLRYLQHPLIALLLVVAGARFDVPPGWLLVLGGYFVFRTVGKLAGGWLTSTVVDGVPRRAGWLLISPGIVGLALALNALQVRGGGGETGLLFAAVVGGSIASEVLSLFVRPEVVE